MPSLGSDMDEGTLDEWLIKPGDMVTRGQVVAIVETSKAAVEIECWHEGTVGELLVPVGRTVRIGAPLATLLAPGEAPGQAVGTAAGQAVGTAVGTAAGEAPRQASPIPTGKTTAAGPPPAAVAPQRRRWVTPAARRLAATTGVDVDALTGTGPQGSITIGDVERAAVATQPKPKATAADRAAQMRTSIAAAMSRSKREIPHYYLAHEIVMDAALAWLTERNADRPITERVLPAVLQLKAVALAAARYHDFNGFWRCDTFEPAPGVHIGVAISLRSGGLVAPAIHDVGDTKLDDLMSNLSDLVARARAGSLRSSEMSDPTITVTNLGEQGVDTVFGVIYPPQVALVGFGRPAPRVRAVDGGIRIATTVHASLAADHRASDGHRGALFLSTINDLLQRPDLLDK